MSQLSNQARAEVLIRALPYIQDYNGKTLVIKYGGNAMINEELQNAVMGDLVLLNLIGVRVVLVHGGGPEISDMLKRVGKESVFVDGLRVTDAKTAEIAQMVLAGKINKNLVAQITRAGGKAVGLCGMDGAMLLARKKDERLGFVGEIEQVNTDLVTDMLDKGYIPVIATTGYDMEGNSYNINADTAAAEIAAALKAQSMISMTDIAGLLEDKDDPSTLISKVYVSDIPALIKKGIIGGGMIPKVDCCLHAIRNGVKKVFIIDGRIPHSILIEVLTDEGIGTMFVQ